MGDSCLISIAKADDLAEYKELLEGIVDLAEHEISIINNGGTSEWYFNHLNEIILPEAKELLEYILKGQLFLKYGRDQRRLESTYYMTDWIIPVDDTPLGIFIRKLQHKINAQE